MICSLTCSTHAVANAITGEAWAQTASERVELRWQGGHRVAHVAKCAYGESILHYAVTRGGIRAASNGKRKEPFSSSHADANRVVASRHNNGK